MVAQQRWFGILASISFRKRKKFIQLQQDIEVIQEKWNWTRFRIRFWNIKQVWLLFRFWERLISNWLIIKSFVLIFYIRHVSMYLILMGKGFFKKKASIHTRNKLFFIDFSHFFSFFGLVLSKSFSFQKSILTSESKYLNILILKLPSNLDIWCPC